MDAEFEFDQKEVKEQIALKRSAYESDEVAKLLKLISADSNETIVIPEEPVYFLTVLHWI
jgi:predicted Zn-dependent protease